MTGGTWTAEITLSRQTCLEGESIQFTQCSATDASSLPPRLQVPRPGENEAFDEACSKAMGDDFDGDAEDREELRR